MMIENDGPAEGDWAKLFPGIFPERALWHSNQSPNSAPCLQQDDGIERRQSHGFRHSHSS